MKTPSLLGRGSLFAQFLFAEYAKSSARPASCKRKAIKAAPKAVILAILFHVIQNGAYYTLFCFVLSMGNAKKDLAIFGFCHCILHWILPLGHLSFLPQKRRDAEHFQEEKIRKKPAPLRFCGKNNKSSNIQIQCKMANAKCKMQWPNHKMANAK